MAEHEFNGAFDNAIIKYISSIHQVCPIMEFPLFKYRGDCTRWVRAILDAKCYEIVKITNLDMSKFLGCFTNDPEALYRNMQTK